MKREGWDGSSSSANAISNRKPSLRVFPNTHEEARHTNRASESIFLGPIRHD